MKILLLSPYPDLLAPALRECGDTYIACSKQIDNELCAANEIEFLVSYGYRHIISREVLSLFPRKSVNLHLSYLPFSRGAHPNFWSIAKGSLIGVTIHLLDEGLDTGNILYQKEVSLDLQEHTFATSYNYLRKEMERLFYLNWKYIRTAESPGWNQKGVSTYHRTADINQWMECLPQMWDTPITVFRELAKNRGHLWTRNVP